MVSQARTHRQRLSIFDDDLRYLPLFKVLNGSGNGKLTSQQ